ncbi:hypothetical protein TELCIR_14109, partial [Teladorsagia circumcincta]
NIAALRYVAAVCPTVQAVVKLDDDVAWNIQNTKRIVDDAIRDQRIYCPLHVSMKEYSETHYPPHCSGLAYAMPRSAYFSILGAVNKERYFWVTKLIRRTFGMLKMTTQHRGRRREEEERNNAEGQEMSL